MSGVLENLKVLDLSWGVAGPMTGMLLCDHGADVTRIERPEGDPFEGLLGYKVWHRGKKNAVLNLKDDADLALFRKLAADADIVIESFTPGVTQRLKIDYPTLAATNPGLIYCSITGYGDDTPDAQRPGYDGLVAARLGLQYEQRGWPEGSIYHIKGMDDPFADLEIDPAWIQGADREGPLHVSSPWPSLGAFFSASAGISAALYAREQTGNGQHVKTSLMLGALACTGGVWQRMDEPDAEGFNTWIMCSKSPKGHFKTSDGRWIHNWVPNPRFVLEASKGDKLNANPDLTVQNDPDRFGIGPEELLVMSHYHPILADAMGKFPCDEWVEAAATAGVTMQECRSIEASLTDPLLLEDGCVTTVEDPELGPINQVGITYRLETSPGKVAGPARAAGSDTEAVKAYAASLADPETGKKNKISGDPPLKGIRVLDLGLAIAGPFGCQLLSDMGAEVIKINTLWDSFWHRTHIAYMANRGKRSIALMLKHPKGMEVLKKLIASCDVIQHNMRYAAAERLGLDYDSLKKEFPELIYCHTRGFEKGPRMELPGNDQTGACLAGIQYSDGAVHAGGHPLWSLTSLGDTGNGFLSAIAICQALYDRKKTGKGQFVDTSIINAALLNTSYAVAKPDGSAVDRPLLDLNQTGFGPYHRIYKTADGWIMVTAFSEAQKSALDSIIGSRTAEASEAEAVFAGKPAAEWLKILEDSGVPAELSDARFSLGLFDNADFKKRGWIVEYNDRFVGKLEQIGATYELSDTPTVIQGGPLIVGDNTESLLRELGYSEEDIDLMAGETAVLCDPPREGQSELESAWKL